MQDLLPFLVDFFDNLLYKRDAAGRILRLSADECGGEKKPLSGGKIYEQICKK